MRSRTSWWETGRAGRAARVKGEPPRVKDDQPNPHACAACGAPSRRLCVCDWDRIVGQVLAAEKLVRAKGAR